MGIWNERYSEAEYIYGEAPNRFFADMIIKLRPGKVLLPCEGEGRNGVYAASLGWEVKAFDGSSIGKAKAMQLAAKKKVSFEYLVKDATEVLYDNEYFDVIGLIYAHFPSAIRCIVHQRLLKFLKPGGIIILEAFNPLQLKNTSGGPKDISMLYTIEMLKQDFEGLQFETLETANIRLEEGKLHEGEAEVIRMIARLPY